MNNFDMYARVQKVLAEGVQPIFYLDEGGREDPNTTQGGQSSGGPMMAQH